MYMYSNPIDSQYIFLRWSMILLNLSGPIPTTSPALKTRSRSVLLNPKFSISSVGEYFLLSLTGLVIVKRCPLCL